MHHGGKKDKKKDAYSHASPKALEGGSEVPQIGLPRLDSQAKGDTPEKVHRNKSLKRGQHGAPSVVSFLARKHSRTQLGRGLLTLELAGWLGASGKNSKSLLRSKFRHLLLSCIWENCLPSFPLPSWSQDSSSLAWLRVAPGPPRFLFPGGDLTSLAEQAQTVSIFLDTVMSIKVLFVSVAEAVGKRTPPRTNVVCCDRN